MSDTKVRKAINVSLQSKKYTDTINEIVQEWESQNLNISSETCDALLLVHRLKKFSSLSNIFNIVKMLDNLSEIYHYTDEDIDKMLNQIIGIDNEKFSQILIELNNLKFIPNENQKLVKRTEPTHKQETKTEFVEEPKPEIQKEKQIEQKERIKPQTIQEDKFEKNIEIKEEEPIKKENNIEEKTMNIDLDETDSTPNIPFDFLMNS